MHANARPHVRHVLVAAIGLVAVVSCHRATTTTTGDAGATSSSNLPPLRVAAAADLARTLPEIGTSFERTHGRRVEVTFGASGMLAKQLAQGAPFDVFLSADAAFVDDAVKSGACIADTKRTYARGHLALWTKDEALRPNDVRDLVDAKYKKIAIANPEHAPYGRAAKQALTSAGVWSTVAPRVVYGENVGQTLAFAQTGNAEVAIVAQSLVADEPAHVRAIEPALHDPLEQSLIVCQGGANGGDRVSARAFADFMGAAQAQAILMAHGFSAPKETSPSPAQDASPTP